ncbi:hypothetical protein AB0D27_11140 [Streptomyces sp. NPDC048415]|uniref:hypothetical protein n=1 Tax=Streptomyces sp. NPDC048415 TaxID=3154822 RepID=UPI00341A6BF5
MPDNTTAREGDEQQAAEFRAAVARALAAEGRRAFTSETYTREGMFAALREIRRSQDGDPHVEFIGQVARLLAVDIAGVVDVAPKDIASVLMAAGGAVGVLAELHGLRGTTVSGVLQYAADELDLQAKAGEQS